MRASHGMLWGIVVLALLGGIFFTQSSDEHDAYLSPPTDSLDAGNASNVSDEAYISKVEEVVSETDGSKEKESNLVILLKDVGEPQYHHFGLTENDFKIIRDAGYTAIEGTFDICASSEDVQFFLDTAKAYNLRVILNAGAGEAEWGYACDGKYAVGQKPVWQRESVQAWVRAWKDHPALLAWDTSNEDGGTMPFGTGGVNPQPKWEKTYALKPEQLRQAYSDVKQIDPNRPIMIRMNGWYFYDYDQDFFREGNYFAKDVADIVMVNAYSNVEEYFDDFVRTVLGRAISAISAVDPDVVILPSLGVWHEPPLWLSPSINQVRNDYESVQNFGSLYGISYFKYGAFEGGGWYFPHKVRGNKELWDFIAALHKEP